MRKFTITNYNNTGRTVVMVIIDEDYIESNKPLAFGFGFEILVLPSKYKNIFNRGLDTNKLVAEARCGEVIYV